MLHRARSAPSRTGVAARVAGLIVLACSISSSAATIKVACVVTGHIVAVIAAHDKALRLLPAGHQLTGQLTMMLVMVFYTFTGLYLLFGG